ncbi:P-loop containing nucleoside triphosphate hydrolase protein [Schizophyllum commune]
MILMTLFSSLSAPTAAKEREKAQKAAAQRAIQEAKSAGTSRAGSPAPKKKGGSVAKSGGGAAKSGAATPARGVSQQQLDLSGLNIGEKEEKPVDEPPPKAVFAREKLLEEARRAIEAEEARGKKAVSLVVIGHVDAGKSTLMGRLLYELGALDEKTRSANERGSSKVGKRSFAWAWNFDGTLEERERGITMDIATRAMATPHRQITILDAPGHKDFVPNMISGAAQADCALLVVDATTGEFESGFERGGQTREHLILVRSLGVTQVVVAVNKLDQVNWDRDRYDDICEQLKPFLVQTGFQPSKTSFVPVAAMQGINLANRDDEEAAPLKAWYDGPTLLDVLDQLDPPARDITAPLRIPIANVFKGSTSGTAVSGRICGGIVQVGDRVRVLPGDETAYVKTIETEDESLVWAASGSNVTLYLTNIDPINLNIGSVLCLPHEPIPLAASFSARIIVFDVQIPITTGTTVELFHHSRDVPATISKLVATLDRGTGKVLKEHPRVLTKSTSAEVCISLRATAMTGPNSVAKPIPIEPFSVNKDMGRILIRRGGETIAAGIVVQLL